ncbi:hypothetical protein KCU92_g3204, partial [Aureobasidium melanogenum]
MTNNSLDKLPPEILSTIVDLIEDESGWREYPTETLLSLRLTCKTLEQACHKNFLLYFSDWLIDLEKEKDLSITKAVLASPAHKAAIEKITFVHRGTKPSLWQVAPLLNEVLSILVSSNHEVALGFDPFGYSERSGHRSTEIVLKFIVMILTIVETSGLKISSIRIQARREDWDVNDRHWELADSLDEPHHSFTGIDFGWLLAELHDMLTVERDNFRQGPPPELVAEYPDVGHISLNYVQGCLRVQSLDTFHWLEFADWLTGGLELKGKDEIRLHLDRLSAQFVEEIFEEYVTSHDEHDDESDTDRVTISKRSNPYAREKITILIPRNRTSRAM